MPIRSLLGVADDNGHSFDAVPFDGGEHPQMIALLRWLWADQFNADTAALVDAMVRRPRTSTAAMRSDSVHADLRTASSLNVAEWLYLVDVRTEQILVYEATIHDRWLHHSTHPLRTPPQPRPAHPSDGTAVGDPWRPASVSLDGLYTSWPARILVNDHRSDAIVVQLDLATLADIIGAAVTLDLARPDGMPAIAITNGTVTATWYSNSDHEQVQRITPDGNGEVVIGPHLMPWTLPQEQVLGYDIHAVTASAPVRQWVSQDEFRAHHPDLAAFPLTTVCAAILDLSPHIPAVLGTDRTPHVVWLVAPTHALMVTPASGEARRGRRGVTLPRPLAGTWSSDPEVVVLSPIAVAAACLNHHNHRP
ncbi:hypothetical protein [Micromonospora craterilacus]|nr:hypothetical protein [Micromonospora craterilacus]